MGAHRSGHPLAWWRKEDADERPSVKSEADKNALREVLEDLETRLEAYLVEWRRQLGVQERPGASIDHDEQPPVANDREESRR